LTIDPSEDEEEEEEDLDYRYRDNWTDRTWGRNRSFIGL